MVTKQLIPLFVQKRGEGDVIFGRFGGWCAIIMPPYYLAITGGGYYAHAIDFKRVVKLNHEPPVPQ